MDPGKYASCIRTDTGSIWRQRRVAITGQPSRVTLGSSGVPPFTHNFNVVFDTFIHHWMTVVEKSREGSGKEGLVTTIQALLAIFYASEFFIASTESSPLQESFDALTGLFECVGIRTNKRNIVSMSCWPCHITQSWSKEAYNWRMTGMRLYFWERLRQRVHCPECGVVLMDGSIMAHC